MSMCDMAHEADMSRILPNVKANIPFFFSHSRLSKYFVECLNFIAQVQSSSPEMKLRIMEGCFVNRKGGRGNNIEADLRTEHSIRNRKDLIRSLGANKTIHAIENVCQAADTIAAIVHHVDIAVSIKAKSGRHTNVFNEEDLKKLEQIYVDAKPFVQSPGRKLQGFRAFQMPLERINKLDMQMLVDRNLDRLSMGMLFGDDMAGEDDELEELDLEMDGLPDEF